MQNDATVNSPIEVTHGQPYGIVGRRYGAAIRNPETGKITYVVFNGGEVPPNGSTVAILIHEDLGKLIG